MIEVMVSLDFPCACCDQAVGVTVKCEGKGLTTAARTVAAVNVPCPGCGAVNKLYFEPNGTVRAVTPCPGPRQVPEPSLN